jgi:hypothetical protein
MVSAPPFHCPLLLDSMPSERGWEECSWERREKREEREVERFRGSE